jgi:hypothetical protein
MVGLMVYMPAWVYRWVPEHTDPVPAEEVVLPSSQEIAQVWVSLLPGSE